MRMEEVDEGGQTTGEGQSVEGTAGRHRLEGRLLISNMRLKKKRCSSELVVVKYRIFLHNLPLYFPERQKRDRERQHAHLSFCILFVIVFLFHVCFFNCNRAAELQDSDWSETGSDGLTEQEIDGIINECLSLPIPNPKLSFSMSPFWSHSDLYILHSQQGWNYFCC